MVIKRHIISRPGTLQEECDYVIKRESTALLTRFAKIRENPHSFGLLTLKKRCKNALYWCELANRPASVSYSFLSYAHQFGYNSCLLRYHKEVELIFGRTKVKTTGDGAQPSLPSGYLTDLPACVYLALIKRNKEAQLFYSNLELHPHENNMYSWRSSFVYDLFLQSVCKNDHKSALSAVSFAIAFEEREMQKALDRSDVFAGDYQQDSFSAYSSGLPCMDWEKENSQALKLPLLQVYKSIFANDEKQFNQSLRIALEKHKAYYEKALVEGEDQKNNPEGWLSLPLTAACSLAESKRMKREIQSDYIPEWLISGDYVGLKLLTE